ncbi:hypothetical protein TURU_008823 [Turdus rufiventris]|nr:hypothetical protein TURU_008823 [Turdus rufiventris]
MHEGAHCMFRLKNQKPDKMGEAGTRADIIPDFNTSHDIESAEADNSEDEDMGDIASGLLDAAIAQLMISDMEDKDFEGFEGSTEDEIEATKKTTLFI